MNKNEKLYVVVGVIAVVFLALFSGILGFSIIKIGGNKIMYDGHSYDCSADTLDLRHNTWATQDDLLSMCKRCVLELTYPVADNPSAQMLGSCEWWTSSTTGESRYRYRAIPKDSSSCNGAADEISCYQALVFAQLITWSNKESYCPNNPSAYVKANSVAACTPSSSVTPSVGNSSTGTSPTDIPDSSATGIPIVDPAGNVIIDTTGTSPIVSNTKEYVAHVPTWAWIIVGLAVVLMLWALLSKKK